MIHNQTANMQNQAATRNIHDSKLRQSRMLCFFGPQMSLLPPLPVQGIVFGIVWHYIITGNLLCFLFQKFSSECFFAI